MAPSAEPFPAYPIARAAAIRLQPRFAALLEGVPEQTAPRPAIDSMEQVIDAAFWASLRREEGYAPHISLALLPPERAGSTLAFEKPLRLDPRTLVPLAPAVEAPGVHLGVWPLDGALHIWGATRAIPAFCFVLETVTPGLLVIKHRRPDQSAKFVNLAVLEGDQMKILDPEAASLPAVVFGPASDPADPHHPLLEIALEMRAHRRGGALLVVPANGSAWRESIIEPAAYPVWPPFSTLGDLMRVERGARDCERWPDAFRRAVRAIGGATSVDGATVVTDRYELVAIGAKIRRRRKWAQVDQVLLTEPVEGFAPQSVGATQLGGTRHFSAAQFAHDQRDARALVASQDGRFTVLSWSEADGMVKANRVESLLM